jgi:Ca2+/H+ antiporter
MIKPLVDVIRHSPILWMLVFVPVVPGAVTMVMIAAVVSSFITNSGRSAWFIGALLLFIYLIFAMTLYVIPPGAHGPA